MLSPRILHQHTKKNKNWKNIPQKLYKGYSRFECFALQETANTIDYPISIIDLITQRTSVDSFGHGACNFEQLSLLLKYSAGVLKHGEGTYSDHKGIPSAGGLNPIEVYVLLLKPCGDLGVGIYHYACKSHALEKFPQNIDVSEFLQTCIFSKESWTKNASCVIFHTLRFDVFESKYGPRGYRYALIESGTMTQNLYLLATALKIGIRALGGTYDTEVEKLLGIDGVSESLINTVVVGVKG